MAEGKPKAGSAKGAATGIAARLTALPKLPLHERLRAAKMLWAEDSPQYSQMQAGRGYRTRSVTRRVGSRVCAATGAKVETSK